MLVKTVPVLRNLPTDLTNQVKTSYRASERRPHFRNRLKWSLPRCRIAGFWSRVCCSLGELICGPQLIGKQWSDCNLLEDGCGQEGSQRFRFIRLLHTNLGQLFELPNVGNCDLPDIDRLMQWVERRCGESTRIFRKEVIEIVLSSYTRGCPSPPKI
jgi:hypothetical protein